jgi:uncharacterized protein (TIGR00369 family)
MPDSPRFQPADDAFAARVGDSFARQTAMSSLGASILSVAPGRVELAMPYRPEFCQQHGFLHAGTVTTVIDSACGYAAYSLMPADADVLSIEFKINLLAPAKGERFRFLGQVVKAGRTITNVRGEAFALDNGREKLIATMDGTMMTLRERAGLAG